jgi:hypothetical protein
MIEGISAVTLGTHEMPRAVRFDRALGFYLVRLQQLLSRHARSQDGSRHGRGRHLRFVVQRGQPVIDRLDNPA